MVDVDRALLMPGEALAGVVWVRYISRDVAPGPWSVYWDNDREVVRDRDGIVHWYRDDRLQIHRAGDVRVCRAIDASSLYPKDGLPREALVVRSLSDLADWADVDEVAGVSGDVVHMAGDSGHLAVVTRCPLRGVVLEGAGLRPGPWTVRTDSLRSISSDDPALSGDDRL